MIPNHKITRAMVEDGTVLQGSVHQFMTDASSLRLPPGCFPNQMKTDLGNKQPFVLDRLLDAQDGDCSGAVYKQSCGCITLLIFND
jgi:hypothetical protein